MHYEFLPSVCMVLLVFFCHEAGAFVRPVSGICQKNNQLLHLNAISDEESLRLLDLTKDSSTGNKELVNKLIELNIRRDFLATELYMIVNKYPYLLEQLRSGALAEAFTAAGLGEGSPSFTNLGYVKRHLDTPWEDVILKWRMKALEHEQFRVEDPAFVAAVYTWMANVCLARGKPEVAYDALQYAGVPPLAPFLFQAHTTPSGEETLVFNLDRLTTYVAETILDIDLEDWVGHSEQKEQGEDAYKNAGEDARSPETAMKIQDMVLSTFRVSLWKLQANIQNGKINAGRRFLILCNNWKGSEKFEEITPPPGAVEDIIAIDVPEAVWGPRGDAASDIISSLKDDLGIEHGAPIIVSF